jgi:hypothetical protein
MITFHNRILFVGFGVPIMILLLTLCDQFAATRWLPILLSRSDVK